MGKHFVVVFVLAALVQNACTSRTPAGKSQAPAEEVDTTAVRQAGQSFKIAYDIWHSDRPPVAEK